MNNNRSYVSNTSLAACSQFHYHEVKSLQRLFKTDDVLKKASDLAKKNLQKISIIK